MTKQMGLSDESLMKLAQSAAQATVACFSRKSGVEAALELSKAVNFQLGTAFVRFQERNVDIQCQAGCKFCCHLRVAAFPYEAAAIASYIDSELPQEQALELRKRVAEKAALISGMTVEQHFTTNIECAFLYEGKCSVYPVRPSSCAGYHSLSRERCEFAYNHPADLETVKPDSEELKQFHAAIDEGIKQALMALEFDAEKGELHTAMAKALNARPAP